MIEDDRLREILDNFGLTEGQASTYLVILDSGRIEMSELAERTGLSRSGVYRIVDDLADRDLVSVNDYSSPTTVRPQPHKHVQDRFGSDLGDLSAAIDNRVGPNVSADPIEYVKSTVTVRKHVSALLGEADSEILVEAPVAVLDVIADSLREAVDRGVLVLLLVDEEPADLSADLAHVVRVSDDVEHLRAVVDSEVALVAGKAALQSDSSYAGALFHSENHFVFHVRKWLLNFKWPQGSEVYRGEPAALPRQYHSYLHAVIDTALHLDADRSVSVRCKAVDVETGERIDLDAPVVETQECVLETGTDARPGQYDIVVETADGPQTLRGPYSSQQGLAVRLPLNLVETRRDR